MEIFSVERFVQFVWSFANRIHAIYATKLHRFSGGWREANPLPIAIYGATVVPYQDSFLIVGGKTVDSTKSIWLDSIYRLKY